MLPLRGAGPCISDATTGFLNCDLYGTQEASFPQGRLAFPRRDDRWHGWRDGKAW